MFRRPLITLIIMAMLCFTLFAQQKSAPATTDPSAKPAESAQANPAEAIPNTTGSDLVVLRVSGEPIGEKQVLAAMEALKPQVVMKPDQQNKRNSVLFKGAIDNLIIMSLLKAEAKKQNIVIDKTKVDEQFAAFAKKEEYQQVLKSRGINEAEFRKSIEETLSAQELLQKNSNSAPAPSEAEIQKVYDNNPSFFSVPEQAHVAQIYLKVDSNSTPEQKAETKKKLEEIRSDILAKKITFGDAAEKYSQDSGKSPKGGDVGMVARSQITIKSLEEAIFSATPGSLTPVIESPQGFHLVQVIERRPEGKQSFEEVKPLIQQQLAQNARQMAMRKYLDELKAKATIEQFMSEEEFAKRHPLN